MFDRPTAFTFHVAQAQAGLKVKNLNTSTYAHTTIHSEAWFQLQKTGRMNNKVITQSQQ